jgi:predicted alpha/beta superfamily hydrolase
MKLRDLLTALAVAAIQCLCAAQPTPPIAARNMGAAALSGSTAYDFKSSINARQYRIFVSVPPGFDATQRYGVLYVLDGNQYFGTASEAAARQSSLKTIRPIIVVAVGYQSNEFSVAIRERLFDLTHNPSQDALPYKTGGGAAFQRVLLEEVRPFIVSSFPVDLSAEALWGHSLGGLFALHVIDLPGFFGPIST